MKLIAIRSILFGCLLFSHGAFAEGKAINILEKKIENQSTVKKKKRRRKVQMCHECGKPEPECECEGHGTKSEDKKEAERNRELNSKLFKE